MVDKQYMTHSDSRSVEKENYEYKTDLASLVTSGILSACFFLHIFNLRMK